MSCNRLGGKLSPTLCCGDIHALKFLPITYKAQEVSRTEHKTRINNITSMTTPKSKSHVFYPESSMDATNIN